MGSAELPRDDLLLASAAQFLISGGENEAANVLLSCELTVGEPYWEFGQEKQGVSLKLTGPRAAYDILRDEQHPITNQIISAILTVIPYDWLLGEFTAKAELVNIDPEAHGATRSSAGPRNPKPGGASRHSHPRVEQPEVSLAKRGQDC